MRYVAATAKNMARAIRADADDLYQDAVLRLLAARRSYDHGRVGKRTWVKFHCLNARREHARRAKRRTVNMGDNPEAFDRPDPEQPDPAEEAERSAVRDAIDALPDGTRELLVRRFGLDGHRPAKLRELAADPQRRTSSEAVRQRVERAVGRIRAAVA